jgi:outer membrane protein assembly factor BamB
LLLLPFSSDLPERRSWRLLQFGDFQPKIQAVLLRRLQQDPRDVGYRLDARFRALDARTGKELWTTKLVDAAKATPITYQGRNGKQYVAILAGGGETRGPENPGGRLYVFALP